MLRGVPMPRVEYMDPNLDLAVDLPLLTTGTAQRRMRVRV
jgi:hypothetical protein